MGLRPIQGDEKRLGPGTTLYGTVAFSFVIPKRSAVSRDRSVKRFAQSL